MILARGIALARAHVAPRRSDLGGADMLVLLDQMLFSLETTDNNPASLPCHISTCFIAVGVIGYGFIVIVPGPPAQHPVRVILVLVLGEVRECSVHVFKCYICWTVVLPI